MNENDARVQAIRARLDTAKPGPWFTEGGAVYYDEACVTLFQSRLGTDPIADIADAEFIANAPQDIAFLLAELSMVSDESRLRMARVVVLEMALSGLVEAVEAELNPKGKTGTELWNILISALNKARSLLEAK